MTDNIDNSTYRWSSGYVDGQLGNKPASTDVTYLGGYSRGKKSAERKEKTPWYQKLLKR